MNLPQNNRQRLFDQLPDNSVAIIASGVEQIRNRDVEYEFRAQSDFFYLTGFAESDSVLFLIKKQQPECVLFLRAKDKEKEIWDGRRLGVDSACSTLNVDKAFAIDDLDVEALKLIADSDEILFSFSDMDTWLNPVSEWIQALKQQVRKGVKAPGKISDLDVYLHEQRVIKTEAEIELMRTAAQISVQGHLAAMTAVKNAQYEYQVQAQLEAAFKLNASPRVAFSSIVANGENACILHYTENTATLENNALVLVDAGAEYQGYAGDITTTFPVSGKFTEAQSKIYSLVLKAQKAAIKVIKPGAAYNEMHQVASRVLTIGLMELGLLQGEIEKLLEEEAYKSFFMHGTGHFLGMDVHDVGNYKIDGEWRKFEAGMVVTVEPGLYISAEQDVDAKWHNIGVRIEDDVLVTESGNEVLTTGLPRTVTEIEEWMANNG